MAVPSMKRRRLVLFAGPHKSASSSVQEFFMRHASDNSNSNQNRHHASLSDWVWPYNPRVRSFLPRKGFAPLIVEYENQELRTSIYGRMKRLWHEGTYQNMIFGSEEFDRFGTCPWSNRTGLPAIHDILDMIQPDDFSIIVNYRSPRYEQWISIWRQLTRVKHVDYKTYICANDDEEYSKRWEYLDAVANPLGLVRHFRSQNWKVVLIDMEGVAKEKLDISHVVACKVLGAECEHGWLGVDRILQNAKTEDPGITREQAEEMEFILRQRDCAYQNNIQNDSGVTILHQDALFRGCSSSVPNADYMNTTFLLHLLRAQMGCEISKNEETMTSIRDAMKNHRHGDSPARGRSTSSAVVVLPGEQKAASLSFDEIAKAQILVSLLLLFTLFGTLFKRIKRSRKKTRWAARDR